MANYPAYLLTAGLAIAGLSAETLLAAEASEGCQSSSAISDERPYRPGDLDQVLSAAQLPNRGLISNDDLALMDTRQLAERMVNRLIKGCDMRRGSSALDGRLLRNSDLMLFAPERVVDSIIRHGFINQHTIPSSGGTITPEYRHSVEQQMAGVRIPYSHKGRDLLPKYAMLNIRENTHAASGRKSTKAYGEVIFVFKDQVKNRTTWTDRDTFSSAQTDFPANTLHFTEKQRGSFWCKEYCEAQIWGSLALSDVAYVMVPVGSPAAERLKGANIRTYAYRELSAGELPDQSVPVKRGELLFDPDPQPAPRSGDSDRAALERDLSRSLDQAEKRILQSRLLDLMTDDELLATFKAFPRTKGDSWSEMTKLPLENRRLVFGELATRKSGKVRTALLSAATDLDPFLRQLAILGLASWKDGDARSRVKAALKDPRADVRMTALAVAHTYDSWLWKKRAEEAVSKGTAEAGNVTFEKMRDWYQSLFERPTICK